MLLGRLDGCGWGGDPILTRGSCLFVVWAQPLSSKIGFSRSANLDSSGAQYKLDSVVLGEGEWAFKLRMVCKSINGVPKCSRKILAFCQELKLTQEAMGRKLNASVVAASRSERGEVKPAVRSLRG
jgi:hypothetical protein